MLHVFFLLANYAMFGLQCRFYLVMIFVAVPCSSANLMLPCHLLSGEISNTGCQGLGAFCYKFVSVSG